MSKEINGRKYDWASISIKAPSGDVIGISEISYNDECGASPRYGRGQNPIGYGVGNYKGEGSMSLDRDEYELLRQAVGGKVLAADPFNIVVAYENEDMALVTDTLPDVKITKQDTGGKQGDEEAGTMKLDFMIMSPIKWNDEEAI